MIGHEVCIGAEWRGVMIRMGGSNTWISWLNMEIKYFFHRAYGERGGLVVNASDSGSRGRGFEPHSGQTVLCP